LGKKELKIIFQIKNKYSIIVKVLSNNEIIILNNQEKLQLMGFDKEDYLAFKNISNDRQSIMIGNSIVVNVLEDILKQIYQQYIK